MLLDVQNLCITHKSKGVANQLTHNVSFSLETNQCLGIVGESGSGKSLSCAAINGLLSEHFSVSGNIYFKGQNLLEQSKNKSRELRGKSICMIMQSPMTAFNPLFTIGNHVVETLLTHLPVRPAEALEMMASTFSRVNLQDPHTLFAKYPHELSGGMLQRIMIALAIVMRPEIIIADEPTTAIDYISQQEVLGELKRIREEFQTSLIFISHDLSLVSHIAEKVVVLEKGRVVETGNSEDVFFSPQQPYTQELIENRQRIVQAFSKAMGARHAA